MSPIFSAIVFSLSVLMISCVSTRHIVNPRYGVILNDKDTMVLYSLNQFGRHDYNLEQKTIDALSHCNLNVIPYKNTEQLLYGNLFPIERIDFNSKLDLMKFEKISKADFLILSGFLNNIAQKTNDSIWSNATRFTPEIKYGIVIYDLNKKK